ncbi:hypothetical protein RRG08_014619 [Elysia crispata]|uniref:Uncharacterized protein n=1 Tax=Elysia crispata TaxID=231223 RepID=A0AAE1D3E3_9GAST|nr:hypothetical protein RRG08_014619 [Elysia crispata]
MLQGPEYTHTHKHLKESCRKSVNKIEAIREKRRDQKKYWKKNLVRVSSYDASTACLNGTATSNWPLELRHVGLSRSPGLEISAHPKFRPACRVSPGPDSYRPCQDALSDIPETEVKARIRLPANYPGKTTITVTDSWTDFRGYFELLSSEPCLEAGRAVSQSRGDYSSLASTHVFKMSKL